ncbi:hypothetical protein QTP70_005523 [Hemibagrus guttatus]|uniref:ribonuclease H n=1 Tax=Hemibagrus guttatus TaxID=175788 RepID=A0AAE0USH6_9TELE|nr:hypothetical protein QTP70_005523 [Hemibagrus guttatus]
MFELCSAHNLGRIREGDKWKTTFHTTKGHYDYLVIPYGLTNVPAVFQAFINEIPKDLIWRYVIAYIDDILIYSTSYDDHVHHVRIVLTRLLHHRDSITFLGYVISQRGVEMDSSKDVADYVESCATCAQSRISRQLPAGLLVPLPVPRRPWFHMAIDFVTNLPDSGGHNTVLVAIEQFSKACHLVPLKGLPTAMESATIMFNQGFRIYGLPEDIVSDRGSHFTNRVWRAFCTHLGINISLSSSDGASSSHGRSEPSDVLAVDDWSRHSQEVWERAHVRLQRAIQQQCIRRRHPHPRFQDDAQPSNEPPLDIDGYPAYCVNILHRNQLKYLVYYEGYGPEEYSWVDADNVLNPFLVEEFHRRHPNRPAPQPRGSRSRTA